jgi:p-cumate 2,3-dioxygenase beta subunit
MMAGTEQSVTPRPVYDERLSRAVERFLYAEADLLDRWQLHEWLELFPAAGRYLVPATDKPDGEPDRDLFLIQDDRFLLEQRVDSLLKRSAHAEYPHSRTRRLVTNIAAQARPGGEVDVTANFAVFRIRNATTDTYVGQYRHVLEPGPDETFRFLIRKAVLDLDALRPLGKISIIL